MNNTGNILVTKCTIVASGSLWRLNQFYTYVLCGKKKTLCGTRCLGYAGMPKNVKGHRQIIKHTTKQRKSNHFKVTGSPPKPPKADPTKVHGTHNVRVLCGYYADTMRDTINSSGPAGGLWAALVGGPWAQVRHEKSKRFYSHSIVVIFYTYAGLQPGEESP